MGRPAPLGSAPPELAHAERLDWTQLPARPWKNGAGLTREIASSPRGATLDNFDWRLSVAEVAVNGPFSAYAGIDRTIALLRGAGMRLRSDDGRLDHRLDTVAAPFSFDGEAAIEATLLDGACSDFNVMTRRGRCSAKAQAVTTDTVLALADALLLLCVRGVWTISACAGQPLRPAQGVLWRQPVGALHVRPAPDSVPALEAQSPEAACLIAVRLCQHRSP
jgi:uncharacterized protein